MFKIIFIKSQCMLAFFLSCFYQSATAQSDSLYLTQGIVAKIWKEGMGEKPVDGQKVRIMYKGKLSNGQVFGDGGNAFFSFKLGDSNIIPGMQIAVKTLQKNGKGLFKIPASMGYGKKGVRDDDTGQWLVPPDATLWFEIELLGFK